MISTYGEILNEIVVRSGISTTSSYYTNSMLEAWINGATRWATSYRKWPFTEYYDKSGAFTSGTEEYTYPNTGFKTDSIRFLKIGSNRFEKVNFKDYLSFREDFSSSQKRIFSDFGRTLYINPNCTTGTIYAYGQLAQTDPTSTTAFSTGEEEGNEAIVEECLSYINLRERKEDRVKYHHTRAIEILDNIWKKITDEQHAYLPKESEGMFRRVDVLNGEYYSDFDNPLQF